MGNVLVQTGGGWGRQGGGGGAPGGPGFKDCVFRAGPRLSHSRFSDFQVCQNGLGVLIKTAAS